MSTDPHLRAAILDAAYLTPHDLDARGIDRRRAGRLVASGGLIRLRRGRYAPADLHADLLGAATLGGRLDCVSLLAAIGVFVRDPRGLHVHFEPGTTRLPPRPGHVVAHWRCGVGPKRSLSADLVEALVQACRCQTPRDAIATLDSAWHLSLIDEEALTEVFRRLPRRRRFLREMLDPRCESGAETLVRLMLRSLGARIELQVDITGVGRVDFVVDGWLIVECDSRAHHGTWVDQRRDRRRDLTAAALGYSTVRPIAEDIFWRPDEVQRLLADALARGPIARGGAAHNSTQSTRRRTRGARFVAN